MGEIMKLSIISFKYAFAAMMFFAMPISFCFSKSTFNSNISDSEKDNIYSGKILIRNVDSMKELSLESDNEGAKKVYETAKNLKPAYIAEIIQVRPYKGNEDLEEKLYASILDISSYAGIPYYSERAESWYDLYSSAKITSKNISSNKAQVFADLEMEPFGIIKTQIDTDKTDLYFYYESKNLNKLRYYDKFTCVNPNSMKSLITVFRDGDNWILYGIGAVNAPSIFFLRDRVETSFMNRIKTFCSYFFKKL